MVNALWNATLGYTLRFFWNPLDSAQTLIEDSAIEQLRAFAVRFLRPSGPLSALRVGNTPYGILPISARSFLPKANSPLETRVARGDRLVPHSLGHGDSDRADAARPERRKPAPGAGDAAVGADQALLAGRGSGRDQELPRHRTLRGLAGAVHSLCCCEPARQAPVHDAGAVPRDCAVRPKPTRSTPSPGCSAIRRTRSRSSTTIGRWRAISSPRCCRCCRSRRSDPRCAHRDAERRIAARGDARIRRGRRSAAFRPLALSRSSAGAHQPERHHQGPGQADAAGRVRRRRRRHAGWRPVRRRPRQRRARSQARGHDRRRERSKRSSAVTSARSSPTGPSS